MYKAKNMNIILHFKGSVSFKILFFKIKDKNLLINKFFTESKNHFFFFFQVISLCFFKHNPLTLLHYIIHDYHTLKLLK